MDFVEEARHGSRLLVKFRYIVTYFLVWRRGEPPLSWCAKELTANYFSELVVLLQKVVDKFQIFWVHVYLIQQDR